MPLWLARVGAEGGGGPSTPYIQTLEVTSHAPCPALGASSSDGQGAPLLATVALHPGLDHALALFLTQALLFLLLEQQLVSCIIITPLPAAGVRIKAV